MLEVIAKMDSAVIRALLVAAVGVIGMILSFLGVDGSRFGENAEKFIDALLLLLSTGGIAWAAYARLMKPTPPLTETAKAETIRQVAAGKLTEVKVTDKQGGFARVACLALAAGLLLGGLGLASCSGTKAAYRAAQDVDDTAYVVTRHYRSLLREAADLKDSGTITGRPLEALRAAEQVATPIIIGDEATGQPGLRELARIYVDAKAAYDEAVNADTREALDAANVKLSQAVNDAMRAVAGFLRALEAARQNTTQVLPFDDARALPAGVAA